MNQITPENLSFWLPEKTKFYRAGHPMMSPYCTLLENSKRKSMVLVNPLTPIGSPVTHENLPTNWPNFAASPALLGWPARNRHTAACIHRFSHILRWPPEPVVWFMSESRAVANEHEGYKRTLSIISSSFWMAVGVKGLKQNKKFNSHYKRPLNYCDPLSLYPKPLSKNFPARGYITLIQEQHSKRMFPIHIISLYFVCLSVFLSICLSVRLNSSKTTNIEYPWQVSF